MLFSFGGDADRCMALSVQVDSKELLSLAGDKHKVKFVPGPACHGPANCIRLSFSFYDPEDLREGVQRLAAALKEYAEQK